MAIQFDSSAMARFKNVNLGGADTIANISDGKLKAGGQLEGLFGKMFRPKTAKAENNAARTELLRSLGQAFNISGMSEANGKITFSREFMAKLESILGRDVLKTGDFAIKADGTVSSGKPLTERRIKAIMNKAVLVGKDRNFDVGAYKAKLEYVNTRLAAMGSQSKRVSEHFEQAGKMLDFLEKEVDGLIEENYEAEPGDPDRFEIVKRGPDGKVSERVRLNGFSTVNNYVQDKTGSFFHLHENLLPTGIRARIGDLTDPPKQIGSYYKRVMSDYVMTCIDLFMECEKVGKLDAFITNISSGSPCTEAKTDKMQEFQMKNKLAEGIGDDPIALHNNTRSLEKCIGDEISAMMEKNPKLENWEDFKKDIVAKLKGTVRPIVTADVKIDEDGNITEVKFKPLLDKHGKAVVREVTEADIENLGKACVANIFDGV